MNEKSKFQRNILRKLKLLALFCSFGFALMAQTKTISGIVTSSEEKEGVIGVSIMVKGTTIGTVTDINGKYTISVPNNDAVLVFSMIGMIKQELKAGDSQILNVVLSPDSKVIDEVIVTGYATERKKDITGSVSVVKMKDISSIPSGNVMSTLQGRIPGVSVLNDGTPGGVNTNVSVRNYNGSSMKNGVTLANQSPLYVIDGIQTRDNISTLLNSNDIESIQILKDAASASIYGVQGANGVIIITTRNAEKGKIKVDFDAQFTSQSYHSNIKMLNAQQWGDTYWTAYKNDGVQPKHDLYGNGPTPVIPAFIDAAQTIPSGDTDWAKQVYQTSTQQNYNMTVSKGSENGTSTFSINYFNQDGLVKYTNFTRYNARLNSDYKFLNNRLRVGENVNISNWNQILKPAGIEELTIAQHPIIPVYDINGGYAGPTTGIGDKPNPVRLLDQQKNDTRNFSWRIFGNVFVEAEPIKNLVFRSNFGLNYLNNFQSNFSPKWSEGGRTVDANSLFTQNDYARNWIWSNTLAYNFKINEHSVNALVGTEAKENVTEYLSGTRNNFLTENKDYRYLDAGDGSQLNTGGGARTSWISYFGKINYSFKDRYLLSGTLRQDASSRFGANNNSAVFPAVSIAWRISQESFMKNITPISDLKLRLSWGKNGNDEIDNEATYTKYMTSLNLAGYDMQGINQGVIYNGIYKIQTGNPNIRWEVTTQKNIGADLSMFDSRFSLTLDYYQKETTDMLITRPYIGVIGEGGNMPSNGASMTNKGFEAIVNWRDNINKDLKYDITVTGSVNKNEITYLPSDIYYNWGGGNSIALKSAVGQPFGSWLGYKTDGIFKTAEEVANSPIQSGKGLGRIRYVDVNGDGVIDAKDQTWLGSDQPKFQGSVNLGITYKSLDLSMLVVGMVRNAYNNSKFYTDFFQLWTGNHSTNLLNAWTPETPNATVPALTAVNLNNEGRVSEYYVEDGSYMKLKNIVLGYTIPKTLTDKLKIRNLRVYVQAQDLLTITNYKGADPEGLGYPYPLPRTFTAGLNLGF